MDTGLDDKILPIDALLIGQTFDGFRIESLIGYGGMSVVFKAQQVLLDRPAAVKVLQARFDKADISHARFTREIQATSALSHPNIARPLCSGVLADGRPYLVLEYINGESLQTRLERERYLRWTDAVDIFVQVASALSYAHRNGILHRDIKPANILLIQEGRRYTAKVVDFGIAGWLEPDDTQSQRLTTTNSGIPGSPPYMSPEVCAGKSADQSSDLYSLGCSMYEALCGSTPFKGDSALEFMYAHAHNRVPPLPWTLAIPRPITRAVMPALAKAPGDRQQTADVLIEQLMPYAGQAITHQQGKSSLTATGGHYLGRITGLRPGNWRSLWPPSVPLVVALSLSLCASAFVTINQLEPGLETIYPTFVANASVPQMKAALADDCARRGKLLTSAALYLDAYNHLPDAQRDDATAVDLQLARIDCLLAGGDAKTYDSAQAECKTFFTSIARKLSIWQQELDLQKAKLKVLLSAAERSFARLDSRHRSSDRDLGWIALLSSTAGRCLAEDQDHKTAAMPLFVEAVSEEAQLSFPSTALGDSRDYIGARDAFNLAECYERVSEKAPPQVIDESTRQARKFYMLALKWDKREGAPCSSKLDAMDRIVRCNLQLKQPAEANEFVQKEEELLKACSITPLHAFKHYDYLGHVMVSYDRQLAKNYFFKAYEISEQQLQRPELGDTERQTFTATLIQSAQESFSVAGTEAVAKIRRAIELCSDPMTQTQNYIFISLVALSEKQNVAAIQAYRKARDEYAKCRQTNQQLEEQLANLKLVLHVTD